MAKSPQGRSGITDRSAFPFVGSGRKVAGAHMRAFQTLALLLLVLGDRARAAENTPNVITLSCDGMLTATHGANKPEAPQPLQKMSLVENLDEQIVFFLGYVVPIESISEASIKFGGTQTVDYGFRVAIRANIERATGRMDATLIMSDPAQQPGDPSTAALHYDMVCAPSSN
jgi:hypothetical protein